MDKSGKYDLNLSQPKVAKTLGVTPCTITLWENKRFEPKVLYYCKIIEFLGYNPFEFEICNLGDKIKYYRFVNGLSKKKLNRLIKVDPPKINEIEENMATRNKHSYLKILKYLKSVL